MYLMIKFLWLGLSLVSLSCLALDPQPRQWSHLPIGKSFLGGGYANTSADIYFDPALSLNDVSMEVDTWAAKFIHSYDFLGKSARIDITLPYQHGHWQGLVNGEKTAISRDGMADSIVRFGVNLFGGPALKGREYIQYRRSANSETIVGAGVAIRLPTGQYDQDKLINLGKNRYALRPQLGVVHVSGPWTVELTAEVSIFSDNDDFYTGSRLEEAPLYFVHGHLLYSFRPGLWLGVSSGFDDGGQVKIDGTVRTKNKRNTGYALNVAYPLTAKSGLRINFIDTRTKESTGLDSNTFTLSYSYML